MKKTKKSFMMTTLLLMLFTFQTNAQFINIHATGSVDVCYPNCANLEVINPQAGYQYSWFVGQYDCNGFATASFPIGSGSSYCAMATGQFYCQGVPPVGPPEISNPIDVRVLPGTLGSIYMAAPTASGPTSCVASVSLCFSASFYQPFPGTVIKWYLNNVLIPGATSGSYTATASGYYKYTVTTCVVAISDSTLVTIQPNATITAGGPASFCAGGNVGLSVPTASGNTYQWKLNGAQIGAATNSTYSASSSGSYTVTVTNNGCSKTSTSAVTVVVNPLPSSTINPSIPVSYCAGGSIALLAGVGAGYSWQWQLNSINIVSANASSYLASSPGNYTVITSANGCSKTSSITTVTENPLPGAFISAGGPTTFCSGGQVTLSAPAGAGYSYQWRKNGININGAVSQTYIATSTGNYKVLVTSSFSCTKLTGTPKVITVNSLPSATITPLGPTTFCAGSNVVLQGNTGAGLTYKWKKNGTYLNGATNSSYTATLAGTYKVEVTTSAGCSKLSSGTLVTVPCRENNGLNGVNSIDVHVFPNPSTGDFSFDLSGAITLNGLPTDRNNFISITVSDISGKIVNYQTDLKNNFIVPGQNLLPGIYTAIIKNGDYQVFKKLVKIR